MIRRPPPQNHRCPSPAPGSPPARPRRPGLIAAVLACALVIVVAACTSDGGSSSGESSPSSTFPSFDDVGELTAVTIPEGFVLVDSRNVALQEFESDPKSGPPPLEVLGGSAVISGRVSGPQGSVAGATVRLERVVGNRSGSIAVATAGDGTYRASGLRGGKYRIRAWLSPTLAGQSSALAFVAEIDGRATVDLSVEEFTGRLLQVGLDIAALRVDDTARVRALLTDRVVDGDGIVVGRPVVGAEVRLSSSGAMSFEEPVARTNGEGIAIWPVTCTRVGTTTFNVSAEDAVSSFNAPSCQPRPITSTTTEVDVPDFPVGDEFDVPRRGVLPAGSYETFLDGCRTSFEVYQGGSWQPRRTVSGSTMVLPGPGRDFRPAGGTDGCTYRRTS